MTRSTTHAHASATILPKPPESNCSLRLHLATGSVQRLATRSPQVDALSSRAAGSTRSPRSSRTTANDQRAYPAPFRNVLELTGRNNFDFFASTIRPTLRSVTFRTLAQPMTLQARQAVGNVYSHPRAIRSSSPSRARAHRARGPIRRGRCRPPRAARPLGARVA